MDGVEMFKSVLLIDSKCQIHLPYACGLETSFFFILQHDYGTFNCILWVYVKFFYHVSERIIRKKKNYTNSHSLIQNIKQLNPLPRNAAF